MQSTTRLRSGTDLVDSSRTPPLFDAADWVRPNLLSSPAPYSERIPSDFMFGSAACIAGGAGASGYRVQANRGFQLCSEALQDILAQHRPILSLGLGMRGPNKETKKLCYSLLQGNVLDRWTGQTRERLRPALVTWIESKYHCWRGQGRLGWLPPSD